jgi:hypothetical protein
MAVNRRNRPSVGYGLDNALQSLAPQPIVSVRNPSVRDTAEIGTIWVNKDTDASFILTSIVAGQGQWQSQTEVITGGTFHVTSTDNVPQAIYLLANGGTAETVEIRSEQGTGLDSIYLLSDVGGITLTSNIASANAINILATAGGMDIFSTGAAGKDVNIVNTGGSVNITATEAVADAIVISASAAGKCGVQVLATGAAGKDITLANTGGSVHLTATEAVTDAIALIAGTGGAITLQSPDVGGVIFSNGTQAPGIFVGTGVPGISAPQGSLFMRVDGSSTSTRLYVNTNGTTGWTNVTTAT